MWAGSAAAQDPRSPVKKIGVLWSGTAEGTAPYWGAFVQGMREVGWVDGKTARFIMRFEDDEKGRLPKLAAELVTLGVDTGAAAQAPRKATTTIPIIVLDSGDPIAERLATTLSRPSGNVTGVSWVATETASERLELARELIPGLKHLGVLTDPGDLSQVVELQGCRAAAPGSGVELRIFEVRHSRDFPTAFAALKTHRPQALIYPTSTVTAMNLEQAVDFLTTLQLPTLSEAAQFAEAGILLSYGPDYLDAHKRAAIQVDKILKGAKPANLPWDQATKFELVVNMKTAKALRIKIPEAILLRADEVIR